MEANENKGVSKGEGADDGTTLVGWRQPPPSGSYKINWDIGIEEEKNWMGVGIIIRDNLGEVIAARSLLIHSS
jgi:hypothetical protein